MRAANRSPTWLRHDLRDWEAIMSHSADDAPRVYEKQLRSALDLADTSLLGKHLRARGEWPT